jgi:hypothetical protein
MQQEVIELGKLGPFPASEAVALTQVQQASQLLPLPLGQPNPRSLLQVPAISSNTVFQQLSICITLYVVLVLDEVCNGIDLEYEFETRMGCTLQEARDVLQGLKPLLQVSE